MNIIEKNELEEKLHNNLITKYSEKLDFIDANLNESNTKNNIIKLLEKQNDLIPLAYDYVKMYRGSMDDEKVQKLSNLIGYTRLLNAREPETFNYFITLYMTQSIDITDLYFLLSNHSSKRCTTIYEKLKKMNYHNDPLPLRWALAMIGED